VKGAESMDVCREDASVATEENSDTTDWVPNPSL